MNYHKNFFLFVLIILLLSFTKIGVAIEPDYLEQFRKYPNLANYKGPIAEIDFSTDPDSIRFRTRLINGIKQGPNFSGSYRIVEWGCGTNCSQIAIVNVKTGEVCDWAGTCGASKYRLNSNLLVINPGATEMSMNYSNGCITEFYILRNSKLHKLQY